MIFIFDCCVFKFQWANGHYNEKIYLAICLFDIINFSSKLEFFGSSLEDLIFCLFIMQFL